MTTYLKPPIGAQSMPTDTRMPRIKDVTKPIKVMIIPTQLPKYNDLN